MDEGLELHFVSWSCLFLSTRAVGTFSRFSLWELGNVTVTFPLHDVLEDAVGPSARLMYLQLYTPFVKAMEERVPLVARPHLLTC